MTERLKKSDNTVTLNLDKVYKFLALMVMIAGIVGSVFGFAYPKALGEKQEALIKANNAEIQSLKIRDAKKESDINYIKNDISEIKDTLKKIYDKIK